MRPIDAEAFQRDIARMCVKRCHLYENDDGFPNCRECVANFIYEMLKKAPTIEAKPVVHAHWEYTGESDGKKIYRCTNCQALLSGTGNFCKECGAQMDESISCSHEDDNHFAEDGKMGVKIPVISMEDVPKIMEEMEK